MEHAQIDTAAAVAAPPALTVERDALLPALQWLAKRLTMERDAARAEAKGAITARDAIAAAVGRVETQLDVLLNRALVAENALRAVAARDARGDAPAVAVAA